MESVSQPGEKRFYDESKRFNGYNYRSNGSDNYRGRNKHMKSSLKQEKSRQTYNANPSGDTFNSQGFSGKGASVNCIKSVNDIESKEREVSTGSSVYANSVVSEKPDDKCRSNGYNKNALSYHEIQSRINKDNSDSCFRGRERNVYSNRRRQRFYNESNEGVGENYCHPKSPHYTRYGNSSKQNNFRGNFNHVNNERSHYQYSRKYNSFPSHYNRFNNGGSAEKISSDTVNKPQRTYVFKKSSKNVPKGNPLGMFWPKLSPLKENETVSDERSADLSLALNCDTETSKHCNQHVLNSPSVKGRLPEVGDLSKTNENVLPVVKANSDEISKDISKKITSACENNSNISQKLLNSIVPPDECGSKRSVSDMTSDDESCTLSQKCILISSNASNELVSDSSIKSRTDDFESVKGKDNSEEKNTHCDYSAVTAKNSTSSQRSTYDDLSRSENSDTSSIENSGKLSVDSSQNELPICRKNVKPNSRVHSRLDKDPSKGKSSGNSVETNDRNQNQTDSQKDASAGNTDPAKGKQGKLSNQKSPNNKSKEKQKKGPKFNTYYINLDFKDSFFLQAMSLISQFEMSPHERAKVDLLMADLQWVFTFILPNAQPVLFGSVVAGTAFKNSDVDIYLQCYDSLPLGNVKDFILHYGSAIHKRGCFRNVVKIANARVPIVKAIHNETGMKVDVSFVVDRSESHYGLCNSLLVKHLCSYDYRVRNVIMLVLFWAKCHGFVGKYQMSSFTFILLVIFYLQIVEILPPLHKLIRVSEDATSWPNTFNDDTKLLINTNKESLESLYLGFFTFFSEVRFDEVVISVYAGELVLGALFESMETLPDCYVGYRRLVQADLESPLVRNDMCVQEPFNMSWNTVRSLNAKNVELLKQCCHNVCNVFNKFSLNRVLYVVHSDYQHCASEEDSYLWELPCPPDTNPLEWFRKVLKATRTIFDSILLMCIYVDSDKTDESTFCHFNLFGTEIKNPVRLTVTCEYMVTAKERSKLVKAYKSKSVSDLEKEVKASNLLLEELKKKEKPSRFSAIVYIARNEKNNCVEVSVNSCPKQSSKNKKNDHKQFVSFLKNNHFKYFLSLTMQLDRSNKSIESGSATSEL